MEQWKTGDVITAEKLNNMESGKIVYVDLNYDDGDDYYWLTIDTADVIALMENNLVVFRYNERLFYIIGASDSQSEILTYSIIHEGGQKVRISIYSCLQGMFTCLTSMEVK